MTIGERIKLLRKQLNLTQAQFAEKIGLKATAVGMYESNDRTVTDRSIISICKGFNASEDWLRYGFGEMFIPNGDEEIEALGKKYNLDYQSKAFIKQFSELSELEKKVIFDVFMKIANGMQKSNPNI